MWLQLICQTSKEKEPFISEAAENMGACSITLGDAGDNPVLEPLPNETPLWDDIIITMLFREEEKLLINQLEMHLNANKEEWQISQLQQEVLEEQQWERLWMDDFHPMQFGDNLWIYPSWSEVPDDESIKIMLDPGLAFGTGTHPTTALCLEWLDQNPPKSQSVIDYGCGSGILAIAAMKLGANKVIATDIDGQALIATVDNQEKNNIDKKAIECYLPDDMPREKADLMLANILCGPLIELAKTLCSLTHSGGKIVLSGVLKEQEAALTEAYDPLCQNIQFQEQDGWVRMSATIR